MRPTLLIFLLLLLSQAAQVDPQSVVIVRDSFGVPHIHGRTDAEAEDPVVKATFDAVIRELTAGPPMEEGQFWT